MMIRSTDSESGGNRRRHHQHGQNQKRRQRIEFRDSQQFPDSVRFRRHRLTAAPHRHRRHPVFAEFIHDRFSFYVRFCQVVFVTSLV
ncbi:hypothetical protein, partial [Victivallis vadensis]|uniref:hypothetical protein n=1 Tax=Victivallis vadensis TaxID=172901 RepID=UPI00307FB31C